MPSKARKTRTGSRELRRKVSHFLFAAAAAAAAVVVAAPAVVAPAVVVVLPPGDPRLRKPRAAVPRELHYEALRFQYRDVQTTGSRDLHGILSRRLLAAAYAAAAYVAVATTLAGAVLPPGDP